MNNTKIVTNIETSSSKAPVILVKFETHLHFLDRLSKTSQISNVIEIRHVGTQLFHANRRTDRRTNTHDDSYAYWTVHHLDI